ncbi:hypothetical protein [Paludisphaera rhizosphaerae]|uniref:hypothetical protein n=1 Tax=Paludisphaera rhizosphaerae TaxID=2711216 RepID=UPI0013EA880F|nr:hypothetical protein [Paludisphaera rhizosphaerae]
MNENVGRCLEEIFSSDRTIQGDAYQSLMKETESPVDWAYEAWDDLLKGLSHKDNHVRSIASQLLCNLAVSDPEARIRDAFDPLLAVTKDERFVTARHCLLSLWKIGLAGEDRREMVVAGLAHRFAEAAEEKNGTLIRFDISQGLRKLYDHSRDETIREQALALIESEPDLKYRKKYAGVWKK